MARRYQGEPLSLDPIGIELVPENVLWINTEEAAKLGITGGQVVEGSSGVEDGAQQVGRGQAFHAAKTPTIATSSIR